MRASVALFMGAAEVGRFSVTGEAADMPKLAGLNLGETERRLVAVEPR
jgi:hypothetical protein